MPSTGTIPLINVIPGQTITASLWGNEFENIDTLFIPSGMDDYSGTDTEMRTTTDPYPASATSRPTSLQGELERLRYVIAQLSGNTYWYQDPILSLTGANTFNLAHNHTGGANGAQLSTGALLDNAVTTIKINDSAINLQKMADNSVSEYKLMTSVAGNGLSGGGGTPLAVNTDNSTVEVNADTLRVKDGGITAAKLASTIKPFQMYSTGALLSQQADTAITNLVNYTGPAVLKAIAVTAGNNPGAGNATWRVGIVIDGVTYYSSGFVTGSGLAGCVTSGASNTSAINFGASSASVGTINDLTIYCKTSLRIYAESTSFTDGRWKVNLYVTYAAA